MGNCMEEQRQDKIGTFYILFYSLLIDVFWNLFWGGKWDTIPTLAHEVTLFCSWVGLILKVCIIIIIGLSELEVIKSSLFRFLRARDNQSKSFIPYHDEI